MWANKAEPHNPRVLGIHILYFPFCIHSSRYNMILHYKKIPTCTPPFEVTDLSLNLDSTVSCNHHGSMLCLRSKISGKSWLLRFVRIKLSPDETNHTNMLNGLSRPKPMNSVSIDNYTTTPKLPPRATSNSQLLNQLLGTRAAMLASSSAALRSLRIWPSSELTGILTSLLYVSCHPHVPSLSRTIHVLKNYVSLLLTSSMTSTRAT